MDCMVQGTEMKQKNLLIYTNPIVYSFLAHYSNNQNNFYNYDKTMPIKVDTARWRDRNQTDDIFGARR